MVKFIIFYKIPFSGAAYPQVALYESILASPHRTLSGEEADYFFVPVLDSCIITRADDAPHLSMEVHFHSFSVLLPVNIFM